jgi:hypothetical protein
MTSTRSVSGLLALCLASACGGGGGGGPSQEQRIAACVSIGACLELSYYTSICLNPGSRDLVTDDQLGCMADAHGDCAAVEACLGLAQAVDPACGTDRCEGSVLVDCQVDDQVDRLDCGVAPLVSGGPTCVEDSTGAPACGSGTCASDGASCSGSRGQLCSGGVLYEYDCAPYSCFDGLCADAVGPCTGTGARCEGDVFLNCEVDQEYQIDCSRMGDGWTCVQETTGAETITGCGLEGQCSGFAGPTCEGASSLVVCDQGSLQTVDCTALGFSGCLEGACQP